MVGLQEYLDSIHTFTSEVLAVPKKSLTVIRTVFLLDSPELPPTIQGGEFVLISPFIFSYNSDRLDRLIKELINRSVIGIGIRLDEKFSTIPGKIIAHAQSLGFTVITFPKSVNWLDLITCFHEGPMKTGSEIYQIDPAHLGSILSAARLGIQSVVRKTSETLNVQAGLINSKKEIIYSNSQNQTIPQFLKMYHHPLSEACTKPMVKAGIFRGIIRPLSKNNNVLGDDTEYILLVTRDHDFPPETVNLIDLIARISVFDRYVRLNSNNLYSNLINEIIFNKLSKEEIDIMALDLALTPEHSYFILLAEGREQENYIQLLKSELRKSKLFYDSEICRFHSQGSEVYYFVVLKTKSNNTVIFHHEFRLKLEHLFLQHPRFHHVKIYAGSIYCHLRKMKNSYYEACQTKEYGHLIWPKNNLLFYGDIIIFKHLKSMANSVYILEEIALLGAYRDEFNFDAIATLEAYLETQNYKKAGERIFVHENTMRYRIQRITEILDLDLNNSAITLNFLVKIKIWKLLNIK